MSDSDHETPPHQSTSASVPPALPVPPPATLQDAVGQLANLVQLLMAQFQPMQHPMHGQAPVHPAGGEHSRIKTHDPNPYDGTDPSKLRAFLSQCHLTFQSRPHDFTDDQIKITYAVSWLKGTALHWYKLNRTLPACALPCYTTNWDAFEEALKSTFREPNPVMSATTKLDNLIMKDHHHITHYNVKFNEYGVLLGYNNQALYTRYYKGLAPHIKDALVFSGKLATLNELRTHAQALDLRYWECKDEEKPRGALSSGTVPATSSSNSSKGQSTHPKSSSRSSTPGSSSSSKGKKPDLTNVLGPDGKLLPEEKEHCKKNNLCLICTSKDHYSDKCPSRKAPIKACMAALKPIEDTDEQSEDSASKAESSESPN